MALIDVVKFNGLASRDWIIYKHPVEELSAGAQLIVAEGQVAIFLKGGAIHQSFSPGTYSLSSNNLPLLRSVTKLPFGGKTPFAAEVYFINTVTKLDVAWGTSDPVQLIDPKYSVRLRVRAFGQIGLRINDYTLLLSHIIGTLNASEWVQYSKVLDLYKGILVSKVKSYIADYILNNKVSALEISAKLDALSESLCESLQPEFGKFGLEVVNFFVKSINFPPEDFEEINKILQDRAAFEIMGDSRYSTKRTFDVYEGAATNQSGTAGIFAAGGVGIAAGMAMGNSMASQGYLQNPAATSIYCPGCHAPNASTARFCSACGATIAQSTQLAEISCPACQASLPLGSRFCAQCGESMLPKPCDCGQINPAETKFCSNCGINLKE